MTQSNQVKSVDTQRNWLSRIGGVASLFTGIILISGMINLIISIYHPGTTNRWLILSQNNWLIKIFILHTNFSDLEADLYGLNVIDIGILLLVSMVCLSLSAGFRNAVKVWSLIAYALSVIAIIVFAATRIVGRSTVMLAVLINSIGMFRDKNSNLATVYSGVFASLFLFVGDLTVGVHSDTITYLFGFGYVFLITFFFLIAKKLFRQSHKS